MPVHNENEFKVENFGKPLEQGDLYIKFDIVFPTSIDNSEKEKLKEILG